MNPATRRELLLAACGWAIGVLIFFRDAIFSGFDTITGDEGDARLVVFLHEHWWEVWHGARPWRTPPMFHPVTDVLSYSDTFLLDQLLYTPLRLLGVEPFAAYQLCLIALTGVGYASVALILRRHVGLALAPACLLAAAVAFANNLYVDSGHGQMYSANVVPAVLALLTESWRAKSSRRGVVYGAAAGLVLGLLLWSTFYIGWFAILIGAVAGSIALVLQLLGGEGRRLLTAIGVRWRSVVAAVVGFGLMMIGFLATYWSPLAESRGRSYEEVLGIAPRPFDIINVGRDNAAWGWLMRALVGEDPRLGQLNRAVALTPILLALVAVSSVALAVAWDRGHRDGRVVGGMAAGFTTVLVVLLPVQFGFGGAWSWVYRFVPGGDAIRVYGRIEVLNMLPASLAVGCWLATGHGLPRRVALRTFAVVAAVLIAVEQLNVTDGFRTLDRSDVLAALDFVDDPPPACTSFHIDPRPDRNPDYSSIDAILVAQRTGVPTVNGYSGWQPDGWTLVPGSPDYADDVDAWVTRYGLGHGHCTLNAATGTWTGP